MTHLRQIMLEELQRRNYCESTIRAYIRTVEHYSRHFHRSAAGGLAPDHTRWISSQRSFFLPVKVLSRVFRGKFVAGLRAAFHKGSLEFYGSLAPLAQPRIFAAWLRLLFRHDWIVYAKPPFGGPEHALRYLSGYTHRVAISNRRGSLLWSKAASRFAGVTPHMPTNSSF